LTAAIERERIEETLEKPPSGKVAFKSFSIFNSYSSPNKFLFGSGRASGGDVKLLGR
jgi:hypothetical protein